MSHAPEAVPAVSVIISTFNYGHFISQTVASIQAQTFENWECLIVDDGSTDGTRAVVEKLASADLRISYLYQENCGPSAARNQGLGACSGRFIQFLDADDLIQKRKLEAHAQLLESRPDTALVYGGLRYFDSADPLSLHYQIAGANEPWMPEVSGDGEAIIPALLKRNIMGLSCPLYRRETLPGFFDESLRYCEDWEFLIRLALNGGAFQFSEADETLSLARSHRTSVSKNHRRMLGGEVQMRRRIAPLIREPSWASANDTELRFNEDWLAGVDELELRLEAHVRKDLPVALIDDNQLNTFLNDKFHFVPFPERGKQYIGHPATDSDALEELERQRVQGGVHAVVVAWPAFWWLEHYRLFARRLEMDFPLVFKNSRVRIYRCGP